MILTCNSEVRPSNFISDTEYPDWFFVFFLICCLLPACFLLGLLFYLEDGGSVFIRNVSCGN
jgi:hypothetical protein